VRAVAMGTTGWPLGWLCTAAQGLPGPAGEGPAAIADPAPKCPPRSGGTWPKGTGTKAEQGLQLIAP
jgi:hypothetical protein